MPRIYTVSLLGLLASACSSDPSGPAGGSAEACALTSTTLVNAQPLLLADLQFAGDRLVFATKNTAEVRGTATIETLRPDGSGRTVLYTDSADRRLQNVFATADTVYFLEEVAGTLPKTELMAMPIGGGAPSRVGGDTFNTGRFVGADATSLWILENPSSGPHLRRVARASGVTETVTRVAGSGTPTQPVLAAGAVYFRAGKQGGKEKSQLYRVDASATDATATRVYPDGGDLTICDLNLAGFGVTPTRLVCGFRTLKTGALDGTDVREIASASGGDNLVLRTEGETLFTATLRSSKTVPDGRLHSLTSSGESRTALACDVGFMQYRQANLSFPNATEYELALTPTAVAWIEYAQSAGAPTSYSLRSAPRR